MTAITKYARDVVETEIRTVNPVEAAEMLATMPPASNRKLRESHADMFARSIRNGAWVVTHQGLAFSKAGVLIDGQHRCTGIVRAGVPVQVMVTYGLAADSLDGIDRGAPRSIADVLHFGHGIEGGPMLTGVCFILKEVFGGTSEKLTVAETLEVYRQYQPGIDWVTTNLRAKTSLTTAHFRAALALAWMVDPSKSESFLPHYFDGVGLAKNDPRRRLREFVNSRQARSRMDRFNYAANALHAWHEGKEQSGVSSSSNGFKYFSGTLTEKRGAA